jgi:hypothetical protein
MPRVHIFWQRRIRAGDCETPYWFPSQTSGGSIREDRIVLPIPPGTHWRDVMPVVLPSEENSKSESRSVGPAYSRDNPKQIGNGKSAHQKTKPAGAAVSKKSISKGGLWFPAPKPAKGEATDKPKHAKRAKRAKVKNHPRLVSAARELRDRWLERVNRDPSAVLTSGGRYDVRRELPQPMAPGEPAPPPLGLPLRAALPPPIAA